MKTNSRIPILLVALLLGCIMITPNADAAAPIAKVTNIKGEVLLIHNNNISKIQLAGQLIYQGDMVQTKDGEAQITFNDGALLTISAYTSTRIQEREEKTGFWIFKTKNPVRRITCFVGKLLFKSGKSKRRNYMQTSTAVCGLRGTEVGIITFGDPPKDYLVVLSGSVSKTNFIEGIKAEYPGLAAAAQNTVFNTVDSAANAQLEQKLETGMQKARANVMLFAIDGATADAMKNNPDETVSAVDGDLAGELAAAKIAEANAKVAVEKAEEDLTKGEATQEEVDAVKDLADKASDAADKTEDAVEEGDIDAAKEAADDAIEAADDAIDEAGVPETGGPEGYSEEPTEESPPPEEGFTEGEGGAFNIPVDEPDEVDPDTNCASPPC